MSAEQKTSKGAPPWICAKKLPDEPKERSTLVPVCASKALAICGKAKFKSAAAATRSSWACATVETHNVNARAEKNFCTNVCKNIGLNSKDHDLGGFDQRRRRLADFEAHFANCVGGNDRGDLLPANRELHLRQQTFFADLDHPAHELIAPADAAEAAPPFGANLLSPAMQIAIEFMARNTVMSAGRTHAAQLALVDPLLESGIAHAQNLGRLARMKQFSHRSTIIYG